jgi:hypothetical protein
MLPVCFARSGEVLFFAPPKKCTQKKGDPGGLPATRVPCASRKARRSRNSLRSNRRERPPAFTAMLGCAIRGEDQNKNPKPNPATRFPLALTEYRSHSGSQACTCLRQVYLPSCARPRRGEERRASATADECAGSPSLWVLSLGQARESTSPERAKQTGNKSATPKRAK